MRVAISENLAGMIFKNAGPKKIEQLLPGCPWLMKKGHGLLHSYFWSTTGLLKPAASFFFCQMNPHRVYSETAAERRLWSGSKDPVLLALLRKLKYSCVSILSSPMLR
jgi:hypothetical protein